jgi:arsenite methyltransferase
MATCIPVRFFSFLHAMLMIVEHGHCEGERAAPAQGSIRSGIKSISNGTATSRVFASSRVFSGLSSTGVTYFKLIVTIRSLPRIENLALLSHLPQQKRHLMGHFLDRPVGWVPSGLADLYDETSFWSARFGALLFDHLDIRRNISGLDVGCGTGFPLIELAHVHGTSSRFTGIDIWTDAIERAHAKLGLHGLTNVDLIAADVASMPFRNAHFDLVVCNIGINNFPDAGAALRECRRVARDDARLVLTTNVQGHFGALYALLDTILGETGLEGARDALRREEQHRYSKHAIANLLADSGFAVSRCFEENFRLRFADGSAMLRHSLVKWFLDGWRQAIGAANEREVFNALETQLDAAAARDGCVEMTVPMLYLEAIAA